MAQVMPSDDALVPADTGPFERPRQRPSQAMVREGGAVLFAEDVRALEVPMRFESSGCRGREIHRTLGATLGKADHSAVDGPPDVELASGQVQVVPVESHELADSEARLERDDDRGAPFWVCGLYQAVGFLEVEKVEG